MATLQELRLAAAARGEKTYYTATPCRKGHLSRRYVSNGACIECLHPKAQAPDANSGKVLVTMTTAVSTRMAQKFEVLELAKERCLAGFTEAWAWAEKEWTRRSAYMVKPGAGGSLAPTAKCVAQGRTLDQFRAAGWSEGQLVYEGWATIVPAGTDGPA
jgi:hypothetical protein